MRTLIRSIVLGCLLYTSQVGSLNKINKAFARFEQEHERTPSPEELATELELPKEKVTDTLRVAGRHVSVDAPCRGV